MSSRSGRLLSTLTTVIALGAVAAPLAAAEETPHFIKGGLEVAKETEVKSAVHSFFIKTPFDNMLVLCPGVKSKASIGAKWKSKLTVEFSECMVTEPAGCTIAGGKVNIQMIDQLVYAKGKKGEELYDIFFSEAHKTFAGVLAEIKFEGAECVIAGVKPITGSAIALPSPNKPGEEAEKVTFKFGGEAGLTGKYVNQENKKEETAGTLKFGANPAFLYGEVSLEIGEKETFGGE
ncbi:MAG TPA: hypothetical protein VMU32_02415 [Solirubrobacteraceae bacterium]|nr:hypothetical protein [Solirubrobacteraceae bacterium]